MLRRLEAYWRWAVRSGSRRGRSAACRGSRPRPRASRAQPKHCCYGAALLVRGRREVARAGVVGGAGRGVQPDWRQHGCAPVGWRYSSRRSWQGCAAAARGRFVVALRCVVFAFMGSVWLVLVGRVSMPLRVCGSWLEMRESRAACVPSRACIPQACSGVLPHGDDVARRRVGGEPGPRLHLLMLRGLLG